MSNKRIFINLIDKVHALQFSDVVIELLKNKKQSNDFNKLMNTYMYFKDIRARQFKVFSNNGQSFDYNKDIHFFAAINFSLNEYVCSSLKQNDPAYNFKIFRDYFEVVIAHIKHMNYVSTQEEWDQFNKSLLDCYDNVQHLNQQAQSQQFNVSCVEFRSILENYLNYAQMIINDKLIIDKPNSFHQNIPKTNQIETLANSNKLKFAEVNRAVYHYLKHCVEDFYEYKFILSRQTMITPLEYIQEANGVVSQWLGFNNTKDRIINLIKEIKKNNDCHINYGSTVKDNFTENGNDYKCHRRTVGISTTTNIVLLTYFKSPIK